MPWTPASALGHTRKAKSAKKKRQWSKIANSALKSGKSEGTAIKMANGVLKREEAGRRMGYHK